MNLRYNEAVIKTKQELFHILAFYKAFLTPDAINYLSSLINMDFSVFADNKVSIYDRKQVAGTVIFRETAIYNLINLLTPLFSNEDYVIDNIYQQFIISRKIDKTILEVINLNYNLNTKDEVFAKLIVSHYIGYKETEIKRIVNEINNLKDRHEKYRGFSSTMETLSYHAKLQDLKDRLEEMSLLQNDEEKASKINLLNSIGEIICKEFYTYPSDDESKSIVLLKKTPGLIIEQKNQKV